jgi:hypothetical protein
LFKPRFEVVHPAVVAGLANMTNLHGLNFMLVPGDILSAFDGQPGDG